MVPSTWEWLARICSTSVDPERGSPTMNIGAVLGIAAAAALVEEGLVEKGADARRAAFEMLDVKGRGGAPQCVAAGVVLEGLGVAAALFKGLAQGEIKLRRLRRRDGRVAEQFKHGRHLGVAEVVVLEIGQAPVGLRQQRIHGEHRLVGGLALAAPAEGLLNVADGQTQPHLLGLQPRCLFVGFERLLLPHEPGGNRGDRDPALRVFGFDFTRRRAAACASSRRPSASSAGPNPRHVSGWCADCSSAWRSRRSASTALSAARDTAASPHNAAT